MDKKYLKILVLVAVVLAVVAFSMSQKKGDVPVVSSTSKGFEVVQDEPDYVWFPVPELGIEIKVRKDVANELLYKVIEGQSEKDIQSAEFTTKKLTEIGEKNGIVMLNQNGRYNCTLGVFTRYNMPEKEYIAMQEEMYGEGNVTPIDIGGYFINYASPQSGCISEASPDTEYEQRVITSWWGRPTSEYTETQDFYYHLQKAVRKIK